MIDLLAIAVIAVVFALLLNGLFIWLGVKYVRKAVLEFDKTTKLQKALLLAYFGFVPLPALLIVGGSMAGEFWKKWKAKKEGV
jgi:hypothetical protein